MMFRTLVASMLGANASITDAALAAMGIVNRRGATASLTNQSEESKHKSIEAAEAKRNRKAAKRIKQNEANERK